MLLLVFGSGPGRSGVKVNLLGVQPVEAIRPLVALFLAGYFARRWEWLRELAEPLARQHPLLKRLHLPRVADLIPVAVGMALVLLFFFFQRDLGPALVLACTFLVTYSVARDRWGLAALGLATLVGAFTAAYVVGYPSTVVKRIDMWQSPWDNGVSGGDQVAHALWGLASGGLFGGGLSETSPRYIPTGENDLVLASLGEILGFAGVALVLVLFGALVVRALRIARRTDQPYVALLVVGLVTSLAAQALLIVGGLLGLLPLSGVVTPFLSLGRSSMVSNLAVVGLLLAASRQAPPAEDKPFLRPASRLGLVVSALLAIAAGRAFMVQVWSRGDIMTPPDADAAGGRRGAAAGQPAPARSGAAGPARRDPRSPRPADRHGRDARRQRARQGVRRDRRQPVRNDAGPRRDDAARRPPRQPARRRGHPANAAIRSAAARSTCSATRCPRRTGRRRTPPSSSASSTRGCAATRTTRELLALWDHRDEPFHLGVRAILDRPRDVTLTVDARLQARAAALLAKQLGDLRLSKGAVVVLDVGHRRRAGVGQRAVAAPRSRPRRPGGGRGASGAAAARSRPLRPVPAGLDVQAGDGGGGAARLVGRGRAAFRVQAAARRPRRHAAAALAAPDPRRRHRSHARTAT